MISFLSQDLKLSILFLLISVPSTGNILGAASFALQEKQVSDSDKNQVELKQKRALKLCYIFGVIHSQVDKERCIHMNNI